MGQEVLLNLQELEAEEALTTVQAQYLNAYRLTGSTAKTADVMGCTTNNARDKLRDVLRKLGLQSIKQLSQNQKSTNSASTEEVKSLMQKQEFRCALTGSVLDPSGTDLDHIISKEKGGTDRIENLQWVTRTVNHMKGTLSQKKFIAICKQVAKWHGD